MKRIKILLIALILILGGVFFGSTYAAKGDTRSLGAQLTRPFADPNYTNPKYQYTVPGTLSNIKYTIVKIYDNADKLDDALTYTKALYCLRGGVGFGAEDVSTEKLVDYSEIGEMHADAKDIIEDYMNKYRTGNETGKEINLDTKKEFSISKEVNGEKVDVTKEVNLYDAILWVIDEAYLPKDRTNANGDKIYVAAEYKKELLDKAGVPVSQQAKITDNDIEVIQQLAMWYFTNYDEQLANKELTDKGQKPKPTVSQATKFPAQFLSINDVNDFQPKEREDNLNRLYQYFIYGAIENSDMYVVDASTKARTKNIEKNEFDKTTSLIKTSNKDEDFYEVGPIKFEKNANTRFVTVNASDIVLYDAKGNVISKEFEIEEIDQKTDEKKSGGRHIVYEFVDDKEGKTVTKLEKGKEYKIKIYKAFEEGADILPDDLYERYDMSKITVKVTSSYSLTNAKFLSAGNESQPVVDIEKEKISEGDEITTEDPRDFDLSLRKFITSIKRNNEDIEVADRTPKINTTTLINGIKNRNGSKEYTATYTHPKNALQVETGDKVIYTIRIYNEGEIDGTATEVTDYLPDGLELVPKSESKTNTKYGWTSEDGKTIKTEYLKDTTIKAFDKDKTETEEGWQKAEIGDSGLYYADVQVECKVVAEPGSNDQALRNIAAITADTDDDRDSVPDDPGRDDYNPPADNSTYKEDDDDYEDLLLRAKIFDLSLRKYITEVNGVQVAISREPNVDTTQLINGTSTSAKYNHKKDPVRVKKGDVVTYTIRIYNEGTVDGIPAEITEYIPTYLDFDPNDEINKKYGWELIDNYENNGVGLLKTTYYKDRVLKAFSYQEGDQLDNTSNYQEGDLKINFIVNDTATEEVVMTNTAEISKYEYADNTPAVDRDSGEQWEIDIIEYGLTLMRDSIYKNYVEKGIMTQEKADELVDYVREIMKDYEPDYTSEDYGISAYLDSKGVTGEKFIEDAPEGLPEEILTEAYNVINNKNSNQEITKEYARYIEEFFQSYKGIKENKEDLTDTGYYYEGQEDDDDFEKIIIKAKEFDLSLRKFITSIKRNGAEVKFDDRTPKINTETLINGTFDRNGNKEYTATYEHSKEPLTVKKGDIITYTLRVYNEGDIDGYVSEITDYIPEGLALILNYNTNLDNGWKLPDNLDSTKIMKLVGSDGFYKTETDVKNLKLEEFSETISLSDVQLVTGKVAITTAELKDELIKSFDKNKTEAEEGWQEAKQGDGGLYYKDVQISCLVVAENTYKDVITNVAEISADKSIPTDIDDRDSTPNNKKDPYTTWQEDDDDYEPVVLRYFDLALRKFITGVETNGKTENITSRIPNLSIDKESGNIKYTHPKEEAPVRVANNDVVIYTLRVYNEGTLAGYAEEITDDIPEGLIYLPDHNVNKQYEWKMFDKDGKVTDKLDEAQTIKTEYLSEEKEKTEKRDNLIDPFDSSKAISAEKPLNPDYRDVKVAFRVIEPNTSDRVIVNSAQISEDSDDDEDSDPHKWNEGEDDQDREYIYVKYFDLSLLKWVTQTIVTVDGKTTTTETGFKPNTGKTETTGIRDNKANEPVAKVELDKNKLGRTTVKFVYKIRVTNEGEIAGYATEITDFIPKGLEFRAEDNKKYGWVKEGNDKVTTRALETVLLQPGQSAEVEIVFTWKNDKNNLGLKTNIAEITEDYNEYNSKDIDSTPDNKKDPYDKEQEDDDDFALVILSLKTGKGMSYTLLITTVVTLLAGGIYLIKKYVLRY